MPHPPARSPSRARNPDQAQALSRSRLTERGIVLDEAPAAQTDDPFAMFPEWASAADEKAFSDL